MLDYPTYAENAAAREYSKAASRRPTCAWCDQPIWDDHAYRIDGYLVCPNCIEQASEGMWGDENAVCAECGELITEDVAYSIDGKLVCEHCIENSKERVYDEEGY